MEIYIERLIEIEGLIEADVSLDISIPFHFSLPFPLSFPLLLSYFPLSLFLLSFFCSHIYLFPLFLQFSPYPLGAGSGVVAAWAMPWRNTLLPADKNSVPQAATWGGSRGRVGVDFLSVLPPQFPLLLCIFYKNNPDFKKILSNALSRSKDETI